MMKKLILLGLMLITLLFSTVLMLGSCEPNPSSGSENDQGTDPSNSENVQSGDNDVTWDWDN